MADIAKRNNLGTLVVGENLTWHSMYAATECPGPYLLSKMQDIADRANEINAAYISGRVYLRKHNTDKFFSVDENNHVVLVDKDNAKPWLLENNNGKTNICDFNNPLLKMNVDTDETTLILAEGESEVYADFLNEKTFDICYEVSNVSGLSRTGNTIRKTYDSTGNSAGLKANVNCDHVDEVADVNEEIPNVTSEMPEVLKNRVVKIKHKASGKYLTYCEDGGTNTNGYGETAKLIEKVNDNSDLSQIWKITQYGDDMYCLTTYAEANYSLDFAADNNICVTADSGWYVPNRRTISIVKVENTENEYKIKFPSIGKNCVRHFTLEGETDIICVSSVDNDNAIWIIEEAEPIEVNSWFTLRYNPHSSNGYIRSIPDYAFSVPVSKFINYTRVTSDTGEVYYEGYVNGHLARAKRISDGVAYITQFKQQDMKYNGNEYWYKMDDDYYWYAYEPSYNGNLLPEIASTLKDTNYLHKKEFEDNYIYVDDSSEDIMYYWIAVGPKVVYDKYPDDRTPGTDGTNFYEIGTVDAVLEKDGIEYYLPCRVGDVKGHTWNNGIIQNYYPYSYNEESPETDIPNEDKFDTYFEYDIEKGLTEYNGKSCVEFIWNLAFEDYSPTLEKYKIKRLVFYPNDRYEDVFE